MIELEAEALNTIIHLIHKHAGITMDASRKSLIQNRLRPRLRDLGLESYDDYLLYFRREPSETPIFVDLLTTNETYFYRTPRIWSYIRDVFLPEWFKENEGVTFFAWSGAASSGEEAHTLGIFLQEFKETHPKFSYQIVGTDISGEILEKAEQGKYLERAIDPIRTGQPELFKRYISVVDGAHQVHEKIRSRIRFRKHNLFETLDYAEVFDLVLLRNVLIYFTPKDQEKVLSQVRLAIKPKGTLIIGESESLSQIQTPFAFIQPLIYGVAA